MSSWTASRLSKRASYKQSMSQASTVLLRLFLPSNFFDPIYPHLTTAATYIITLPLCDTTLPIQHHEYSFVQHHTFNVAVTDLGLKHHLSIIDNLRGTSSLSIRQLAIVKRGGGWSVLMLFYPSMVTQSDWDWDWVYLSACLCILICFDFVVPWKWCWVSRTFWLLKRANLKARTLEVLLIISCLQAFVSEQFDSLRILSSSRLYKAHLTASRIRFIFHNSSNLSYRSFDRQPLLHNLARSFRPPIPFSLPLTFTAYHSSPLSHSSYQKSSFLPEKYRFLVLAPAPSCSSVHAQHLKCGVRTVLKQPVWRWWCLILGIWLQTWCLGFSSSLCLNQLAGEREWTGDGFCARAISCFCDQLDLLLDMPQTTMMASITHAEILLVQWNILFPCGQLWSKAVWHGSIKFPYFYNFIQTSCNTNTQRTFHSESIGWVAYGDGELSISSDWLIASTPAYIFILSPSLGCREVILALSPWPSHICFFILCSCHLPEIYSSMPKSSSSKRHCIHSDKQEVYARAKWCLAYYHIINFQTTLSLVRIDYLCYNWDA